MIYILVFLVAAAITRYLICNSGRLGLMDIPNERSSHVVPTPRGGGVAIVFSFYVGMILAAFSGLIPFKTVVVLIGGTGIIAIVGFMDDRRHVAVRWRLMAHVLSSTLILAGLGTLLPGDVGWAENQSILLINLLALLGLVWLINLYNFMDGIDAIAGSEAIFVACAAAVLCALGKAYTVAMLLGFLAAGAAGFQIWNIPPAKIFMGDVGSGFLGLVLGALAIISIKSGAMSFWTWLILLGVFTVDTLVTLARRVLNGNGWYEAHCSHAYQNLARRVRSHGKVTGWVAVVNLLWLFPIALVSWHWPMWGGMMALIAFIPLIFLAFYLDAGRELQASRLVE